VEFKRYYVDDLIEELQKYRGQKLLVGDPYNQLVAHSKVSVGVVNHYKLGSCACLFVEPDPFSNDERD